MTLALRNDKTFVIGSAVGFHHHLIWS